MALIQRRIPRLVSFSNSPIVFALETDYIQTLGTESFYLLKFSADPAAGETLNLTWDTGSFSFIFATGASPNNATTIPTGDSTLAAYYQSLVLELLQAADVVANWDVFYDTTLGFIVFRNTSLEPTNMVINGTSPISFVAVNNGQAPILEGNYFLKGKLIIHGDNKEIVDLGNYKPNIVNERVEVDVSEFIKPYLDTAIPVINETLPVDTDKLINLKYEVYLWDEFDTAPAVRTSYYTGELYCLKGGLSYEDFPQFNDLINDWIDTNGAQANFLTYRPELREVTIKQEEFLYFFNPYNGPTNPGTPA